ncbi:hypothetical protein COOONC_00713 [Cooperia oncophora]
MYLYKSVAGKLRLDIMTKPTHAIVFFTSSKTADIVALAAISGSHVVNTTSKVRWNKKVYKAKVCADSELSSCVLSMSLNIPFKIVHIGTRAQCEEKIKDVNEEGTLMESFFTVGASSVTGQDEDIAETVNADPVLEALHHVQRGMSEMLEQMMLMRRTTAGALREFEMRVQGSFSRLERRITDLESSVDELKLKQGSTSTEDGIDFSLLSRERVETLLSLKCGRLTKFALALEQELYEHDPSELLLNVEDRKLTARRVNFIREVVFKYFNVSESAKKSVWQTVKNALDGRVRTSRARKSNVQSADHRGLSPSPARILLTPPRREEVYEFSDNSSDHQFFEL